MPTLATWEQVCEADKLIKIADDRTSSTGCNHKTCMRDCTATTNCHTALRSVWTVTTTKATKIKTMVFRRVPGGAVPRVLDSNWPVSLHAGEERRRQTCGCVRRLASTLHGSFKLDVSGAAMREGLLRWGHLPVPLQGNSHAGMGSPRACYRAGQM
ncbi:hypothetical protein C8Q70DRAFT_934636 [Cubamyces menziesii]|nr:hypothetical protein C8Q70DRAFT_934636 [Cubamyces menziesii]